MVFKNFEQLTVKIFNSKFCNCFYEITTITNLKARNYQFSWDCFSSGEWSILKEGSWYTGERQYVSSKKLSILLRLSLFRRVEYPERGELIYRREAVRFQQEITILVKLSLFRRVEYPERGELICRREAVSSQQEMINSRETVSLFRRVEYPERGELIYRREAASFQQEITILVRLSLFRRVEYPERGELTYWRE